MKSPLKILHLEDSPNDAKLVQSTLKAEGIACETTRVETEDDFVAALERGDIDLILSDFTLPRFDGLSAFKIARTIQSRLPFIFVSGTLGEERAIESLKGGATDYVLKNRLSRLAPAVKRALQEVEDRAERNRLEVNFIEAQKMDVIGQLAAGVAHDFNNILAVVMGYSDMLLSGPCREDTLREYVGEIRHASERAAGLTRQLLVFSRKQTILPLVLDLKKIVKDMNEMLRRVVDEQIELTIIPGEQVGRILADSGYIGQVLMNLVVNARDAMPHGGKLTISTHNASLADNDLVSHPGAKAGEYVVLNVSDTGTGMTDEVKAHLFEAFFTTKQMGKGTGLGLATCQTIVQQSGGHICLDSEMGKGTTFKIYFPRVDQPLHVATIKKRTGPLPHARGTETLLVVEDDQSVRHLARGVLEAQGYQVLSASNGQDALHVIRDHEGSPIRLVVTDVIMPQMGGIVMADWLKVTYPDIKILFTSGYADDTVALQEILTKGIEFLPKPYAQSILIRKVREMLDIPIG
jgi:two-component system cell cycle sensor histidine kinase/response regulator CckA